MRYIGATADDSRIQATLLTSNDSRLRAHHIVSEVFKPVLLSGFGSFAPAPPRNLREGTECAINGTIFAKWLITMIEGLQTPERLSKPENAIEVPFSR